MLRKNGIFMARILRIIGIIVALVALLTIGYYGIFGKSDNITKVKADINTPVSSQFSDDNSVLISANLPDINNTRKINAPDELSISYDVVSGPYNPTFNYDISASELAKRIKIMPAIRGKWSMPNPTEIIFTPSDDWPSSTKFTVKLSPKLFTSDVRPNTTKFSFKTAAISAKTDIFNVYPAPDGGRKVIGIAVISFSRPIQTKNFSDKISMRLDGKLVDFDVKFDRYLRTAIIKTAPIQISDGPQILRLKINRIDDSDEKSRTEKITATATIDAADNFFKISNVSSIVVDDKQGNPQQLILIDTTAAARPDLNWDNYINAYLLPKYATEEEEDDKISHTWASDEINSEVIKKSKKLPLNRIDFVNPAGTYQYAFAYDVSTVSRYIYVEIKPGMDSVNGFTVRNGLTRVLAVAYPTPSVKIAGGGALLSLAGDRKLGIVARGGVETAYVNMYKIEAGEINHLITQTYDLFSDINFRAPWIFNTYDMSNVFQKKIPFADTSKNRVNYAPLNLGEYLDRTYKDKTGIFIIKTGASENSAEYGDARLILLTDLGIIRKINLDQSSMVFISHLSNGSPATDTDVSVLGRNGYPVWAGTTNSDGMVNIPHLAWDEYRNEKEPVAIVARHGDDISFIPYNADSAQRTEYSKFDVAGIYASGTTPLNAFIFSDRGIYKPGETLTVGTIIENKNFTSVAGIPVKLEISDSRDNTIFDKKISLPADGMFDITHKLSNDAGIGTYYVHVYSLNNRGRKDEIIGTASFKVAEFVPDTMKIMATIDNVSDDGWVSPNQLIANVALNNLYGMPATDRRISATASLVPSDFKFEKYPGYVFTPNFAPKGDMSEKSATFGQTFSATIEDVRTDGTGNATVNVNFNQDIPFGTYLLNLKIKGFEAGDGKSISTGIVARVSNFEYLVGYHATSDLTYIPRNSARAVKFITIDRTAHMIKGQDLNIKTIRRENLTSLIKDYENNYKYKTITNDVVIQESKITIDSKGTEFKLDTSHGGTYFVQISDDAGHILANLEYFVASDETPDIKPDALSELQIKLDATEYKPGETISIGITAPYTGSGLITIERDKVYAYTWFTANTTSSTQKIQLPEDFTGTGYINVSFVRDINSRDIFTSPYTYAVVPFSTNIDKRKINIDLNVPSKITDNKLAIEYKTNRDAKIMLVAVNTGILQVAEYQIPNPIKHFFRKAALQVQTNQILSLLLPEFNILRSMAQTGGDFSLESMAADMIGAPMTNPFARTNLPSVAFYSGILETVADKTETITFDVPEYFNGELSIYAVAATEGSIGGSSTQTKVQSPIIISVSAPTFVAPNDKFTVNTIISNLTEKSGTNAIARNNATVSGNLKLLEKSDAINIPENTERLWTFDVMATTRPGTGDINVSTTLFDDNNHSVASRKSSVGLSVRPTTAMRSDVHIGKLGSTSTTIRKLNSIDMFQEKQLRTLYISASPAILARPMFMYLKNYEFDCTEQLVSRTLPYVLLPNDKLFGTTTQDSTEIITKTLQTLANRQNSDGSFGLWGGDTLSYDNLSNAHTAYLTAYTMNFLTLARRGGFNVPQNMFSRGIDFLRTYAAQNTTNTNDAHAKAFAIYVLSRNDYVTTSYIDLLQEYADEKIPDWKSGPIGAYIAASYKMLKQTNKAYELISKYRESDGKHRAHISMFNNDVANDAIYTMIARNYFDMSANDAPVSIKHYINNGKYDSFTAAMIVLGLTDTKPTQSDKISDLTITANDTALKLSTESGTAFVNIPIDTDRVRVICPECKSTNELFYTYIQQGFPKTSNPESNGIEISRKYYDADGSEIHSGSIGDVVTVKITVRTRGDTETIQNAYILDLLPGGFIPVSDSMTGDKDFSEIREDRVIIYTALTRNPTTFTYRAQLSTAGEFTVPAIVAGDMYNSDTGAVGSTDKFTVSNAKK